MSCFLLSVSFLLWAANPQRGDAQGAWTSHCGLPRRSVMFDKTFSAVCTVSKELRLPADVACDLFWWVVGSHPRVVMLSTRTSCFQLAWCFNSSALLTRLQSVAHCSFHPPPRVATIRRQLDSSQLPSWSPLSRSTDREHRAKVWIHRSPIIIIIIILYYSLLSIIIKETATIYYK